MLRYDRGVDNVKHHSLLIRILTPIPVNQAGDSVLRVSLTGAVSS